MESLESVVTMAHRELQALKEEQDLLVEMAAMVKMADQESQVVMD